MLLVVTAGIKYAIIQVDVKNAFLYGDIDTQIYIKQPEVGTMMEPHKYANL